MLDVTVDNFDEATAADHPSADAVTDNMVEKITCKKHNWYYVKRSKYSADDEIDVKKFCVFQNVC